MKGNLILIHGGGPTAVINASLAGAIRQAKKEPGVDRILAAIGGTGGLMRGQVRDLTDITEEDLALLERTPGSAIGTSRDALEEPEYRLLAEKCVEFGAKYVLMNGGNGTMDACGKLCATLEGTGIRVMGIPKTMDNDIAVTDHAPGFGSAARYIAQSVAEVTADVRGLPIHVVVIEASGRNAGWITAASALARQAGVDGPDLIYLPERPFDEEQYLRDVQKLIEEKRGVVVVASEGLKDKDGKPLSSRCFRSGARRISATYRLIWPIWSSKGWATRRGARNRDCWGARRLRCLPTWTGRKRFWPEKKRCARPARGRAARWSALSARAPVLTKCARR